MNLFFYLVYLFMNIYGFQFCYYARSYNFYFIDWQSSYLFYGQSEQFLGNAKHFYKTNIFGDAQTDMGPLGPNAINLKKLVIPVQGRTPLNCTCLFLIGQNCHNTDS